jgi:hypothetical protein
LEILVSTEAEPTITVPLTWPSGVTVPWPATSRKVPLTGARPHMLLLRSPTVDLDASKVQDPASAASSSIACSADAVTCPVGAMTSSDIVLVLMKK